MATTPISASKFTALVKALYRTGSAVDSRSQYLDVSVTPNLVRDFASTQEVLDYLSNANTLVQTALRTGGFPIFVNSGGALANGVITGGARTEYWFKDGVADTHLVLKTPDLSAYATVNTVTTGLLAKADQTEVDGLSAALAGKLNVGDALALSDDDKAALLPEVLYLVAAIKSGEAPFDTNIKANIKTVTIFAPPVINDLLRDRLGWGTTEGKEFKTITGILNDQGQYGKKGQTVVVDNETYVCTNHDLGTEGNADGSVTYFRNRSVSWLNPANTTDAAIIAALLAEAGWNGTTNTITLSQPCTPGVQWKSGAGKLYTCQDTYVWTRSGALQPTIPMFISGSTHPALLSNLLAHNYTASGPYIQQAGDGQTSQGQRLIYNDAFMFIKGTENKWHISAINNINVA